MFAVMATDDPRKLCSACEARMAAAAAEGKAGILLCGACAGDEIPAGEVTATLFGVPITGLQPLAFSPSPHDAPRPN